MPEERQDVYKQVVVDGRESVEQLHGFRQGEGIFVLLDGKAQKVAIVMQHDAKNGNASEHIRLSKT